MPANPKPKKPADSVAVFSELMMPHQVNNLGHVFGGELLSMVDRAAAVAAMRHAGRSAVTNLRHESVLIEGNSGRALLAVLDGTRDRAAILEAVVEQLGEEQRPAAIEGLEAGLRGLARLGLLLA